MKALIVSSFLLLAWAGESLAACSYTYDCGSSSQCAYLMGGRSGTKSSDVTQQTCERVRKEVIPYGSSPCRCDGDDTGDGRQVSGPRALGLGGALLGGLICSFPGVCLLGILQGVIGGGLAGWATGTMLDHD